MRHVSRRVHLAAPTYKGEEHMLCVTPTADPSPGAVMTGAWGAFPAGTLEVSVSLNGRDFHGGADRDGADSSAALRAPLLHMLACEHLDPHDEVKWPEMHTVLGLRPGFCA